MRFSSSVEETVSNTKKLYDICKSNCEKTYLIERASELDHVPLVNLNKDGKAVILITAGASTPLSVIQEVQRKMDENNSNEDFKELLENSLKSTY
jgi:small subunit ribosomal protein S1